MSKPKKNRECHLRTSAGPMQLMLIALMFALAPCFLFAQEPGDTLWTRTYGGDLWEHGYSARQTIDGGYILVGFTASFGAGSADFWLVKTDAIGDTMWTKVYGWAREEIAWDVEQTADGGYIVTGHTSTTPSQTSSFWLMKTDSNGDTLWTRIYGGDDWEKSFSVQPTTDGGYIVVGRTKSFGAGDYDIWLLKTDSNGDTLWTHTYGGSAREDGYCVRQTTDGGYIISGKTYSYGAGGSDAYLVKTDENGDTLWTRTYGGSNGEGSFSVQQTDDGGYVIVGYTFSFGAGGADTYLVKTDALGQILWTRTYGGSADEFDQRIQLTTDGGYIIGGRTESFGAGMKDFYLVRTDANGDTLWTGSYGGPGPEFCFFSQETDDGAFIALGYTTSFGNGPSDFYLVKVAGEVPIVGSISGVVTEAGLGAPIQDVVVTAIGSGVSDITDADGEYTLPYLYEGTYDVSFSHADYRNMTVTDVEVIAGQITTLNVTMDAQPGDILWTRTYGGTSGDFSYSVQQTTDGGYIVTGYLRSLGADSSDVWLLKTDAYGDTLWTRTYGESDNEHGYSVQQTADGGYIIAGHVYSFGTGRDDVYLVKTDADGGADWIKSIGGPENDYGYSVQQTTDGGYIVAGRTNSSGAGSDDVYLVKTRFRGSTQWTRTYGGSDSDGGWAVQQTTDGGYIITGYTFSFGAGNGDVYLVKTDSNGDTLWTRTYGGSESDEAYSVQQTADGGYILTGCTGPLSNRDVYLVKTDGDGNALWTRTYGGSGSDFGRSVVQTADGGYMIAGYSDSFGVGAFDAYLIKTDSDGDTLWTLAYGGSTDDYTLSIQQTADSGYIAAGYTTSFGAGYEDVWLVRVAGGALTTGSISGIVTEAGLGAPIQDVVVTAVGSGVSDITDADGEYTLPHLEEGLYDVLLSHVDYRDTTVTGVMVTAGNTTELNVVMEELTNNIPTLSEWGMIILALLLLASGTVAVIRRRRVVAISE